MTTYEIRKSTDRQRLELSRLCFTQWQVMDDKETWHVTVPDEEEITVFEWAKKYNLKRKEVD